MKKHKKNINLKELNKKEKGITLIALVITVIVLLILAGITISTLTGQNGLLRKANTAKNKSTESELKEQIEMAIMASRINENISINLNELENELSKIENVAKENIEKLGDEGKLPWIVTAENFQYLISENGTVETVKNGIVLSKTQITLPVGGTDTLEVKIMGGKNGQVEWSCSDENVISINEGQITANNIGTSTITASVLLEEEICTVECVVSVISIEDWSKNRIEDIVANNRNEGTNDYDTEKIKDEVNNMGGTIEIIDLSESGKLPLMIVIDDTGYNLNENGEVTVIKGIWVSTTNISIIEGQTYQLYVRYFDGDTSVNPVITPARNGRKHFCIRYFPCYTIK